MPDTSAQNKKGQTIRAKASIHRAMTIFTHHWGQMLQLLGEDACEQNDRGNAWRDFYDGVDGMGHESITNKGEFADGNAQARLGEIEGLGGDLQIYREKWRGFVPSEEQAEAFDEAILLLNEVDGALDEAAEFIRTCLPGSTSEAAQGPDEADDHGEPANRDPADLEESTAPGLEPVPRS